MTTDINAVAVELQPVQDSVELRAERAQRRTFTTAFNRSLVADYDATLIGGKGAVLRRERLYDSHIREWRAAIEAGTLDRVTEERTAEKSAEQLRISELEKALAKLEAERARNDRVIAGRETALEVSGKGDAFLDALSSKNAQRPEAIIVLGRREPSTRSQSM